MMAGQHRALTLVRLTTLLALVSSLALPKVPTQIDEQQTLVASHQRQRTRVGLGRGVPGLQDHFTFDNLQADIEKGLRFHDTSLQIASGVGTETEYIREAYCVQLDIGVAAGGALGKIVLSVGLEGSVMAPKSCVESELVGFEQTNPETAKNPKGLPRLQDPGAACRAKRLAEKDEPMEITGRMMVGGGVTLVLGDKRIAGLKAAFFADGAFEYTARVPAKVAKDSLGNPWMWYASAWAFKRWAIKMIADSSMAKFFTGGADAAQRERMQIKMETVMRDIRKSIGAGKNETWMTEMIAASAQKKATEFITLYREQVKASRNADGVIKTLDLKQFYRWGQGVSGSAQDSTMEDHDCTDIDGKAPKTCPVSSYRNLVEKCFRKVYLKDDTITFDKTKPWEYNNMPIDSWKDGKITKWFTKGKGSNQPDCGNIGKVAAADGSMAIAPEDSFLPIMCAFATGGVLLPVIQRAKTHDCGNMHIRRMISLIFPELFPTKAAGDSANVLNAADTVQPANFRKFLDNVANEGPSDRLQRAQSLGYQKYDPNAHLSDDASLNEPSAGVPIAKMFIQSLNLMLSIEDSDELGAAMDAFVQADQLRADPAVIIQDPKCTQENCCGVSNISFTGTIGVTAKAELLEMSSGATDSSVGFCTGDSNNFQAKLSLAWEWKKSQAQTSRVCQRSSTGILPATSMQLTGVAPLGPTGMNMYIDLQAGFNPGKLGIVFALVIKLPASSRVPFSTWQLTPMCQQITDFIKTLENFKDKLVGVAGRLDALKQRDPVKALAALKNLAGDLGKSVVEDGLPALKSFFSSANKINTKDVAAEINKWVGTVFGIVNPLANLKDKAAEAAVAALKASTGVKLFVGAENYLRIEWKKTFEYNTKEKKWTLDQDGENGFSLSQDAVNTASFGFEGGTSAVGVAIAGATGGVVPEFTLGMYNTFGASMACG